MGVGKGVGVVCGSCGDGRRRTCGEFIKDRSPLGTGYNVASATDDQVCWWL
jgi:hypothetical protein